MDLDKAKQKTESARRRMRAYQTVSKIADEAGRGEIPIKGLNPKDPDAGIRPPKLSGTKRMMKRAYYEARGYADSKIAENEEDNTGIEAARKTENAAEDGIRTIKGTLPSNRTMFRRAQNKLRRKAQRSEEEYRRRAFEQKQAEERAKQETENKNTETRIEPKPQTENPKAETKQVCPVEEITNDDSVSKKEAFRKGAREAAVKEQKEVIERTSKDAKKKASKEAMKEAAKEESKRQVKRNYKKKLFLLS